MPANSEDIRFEQRYVTQLYDRLDALREHTKERLAHVRQQGPSGSPQNRSERDAFATLYEDRLIQLENVEERLVFGRLDLIDSQRRYVGRIGIQDTDHRQLLTDWRAPAAEPFYQATAAHPQGVVLRRHLTTRGRRVTAIEDDVLDLENLTEDARANLAGEGALLAALTAARTGKMGDIVATIQAEQDRIIRAPLAGALVVQGGPGTGKTAVALHRVAYLLYAHRRRLENSGVLVIGPSSQFLRYIENVLPSLGETGVVATTIADLLPDISARGTESDEVAEIKGRASMAQVIRRAVRQRQRIPNRVKDLRVDRGVLKLYPDQVREAIDRARRSRKPHNEARVIFVSHMLTKLAQQYAQLLEFEPSADDLADLAEELRQARDVRVELNLCWMPVTAQKVVETLWSNPQRLAAAAPSMSAAERQKLFREADHAWTPADVPLLDEAAELVGDDNEARRAQEQRQRAQREAEIAYAEEVLANTGGSALVSAELLAERFGHAPGRASAAEAAARDRTWTFGHIVVDEAQELSPMAWRSLMRRCPTRSFTIVGDTAQASAAAGTRSWRRRLGPLFGKQLRLEELTVNYRTPELIMREAASAGRAAGLEIGEPVTAREGDHAVTYRRVEKAELADEVAAALIDNLEVLGQGRAAVVAPEAIGEQLWTALIANPELSPLISGASSGAGAGRGAGRVASRGSDFDAQIAVLSADDAKGLEFDVVVLVEPGAIAAQPVRGAGDLYVAMSRSTQVLQIVHAQPLPSGLPANI